MTSKTKIEFLCLRGMILLPWKTDLIELDVVGTRKHKLNTFFALFYVLFLYLLLPILSFTGKVESASITGTKYTLSQHHVAAPIAEYVTAKFTLLLTACWIYFLPWYQERLLCTNICGLFQRGEIHFTSWTHKSKPRTLATYISKDKNESQKENNSQQVGSEMARYISRKREKVSTQIN